jgi:hypothetical protein
MEHKCLAEIIMTEASGRVLIVKVYDNATWDRFYAFYCRVGNKPYGWQDRNCRTMKPVRIEDIPKWTNLTVRLDQLRIVSSKVTIHDNAAYDALINDANLQTGYQLAHPKIDLTAGDYRFLHSRERHEKRKMGLIK